MKKISLIIIVLLISSITCWLSAFYFFNEKNSFTEKQVKELIPLIEKFEIHHGKYPPRIEEISDYSEIMQKKFLFFFHSSELSYTLNPNGYRIYFYGTPLGPFTVYNSQGNEWSSEE